MRILLIATVAVFALIAGLAAESASLPRMAPPPIFSLGIAGFHAPVWFHGTCQVVADMDGDQGLQVTGAGDAWANYFVTPTGLLTGGQSYRAVLKYRIVTMPAGDYGYICARSESLGYGFDKWARFSGKPGDRGAVTFPMVLPSVSDYTITLGMHHAATIVIDSFAVYAGDGWTTLRPTPVRTYPFGGNYIAQHTRFAVELPAPNNQHVINACDFGLKADSAGVPASADLAARNLAAITAATLAAAKSQAATLLVPAGTYRFAGDGAIPFDHLMDTTIDARGAIFVFENYHSWYQPAIEMVSCTRCELDGLTIDWNWDKMPLATLATVVAMNGSTIDLKLPGLDKAGIQKLTTLKWDDLYPVDPYTLAATGGDYNLSGWAGATFEVLADDTLRVHAPRAFPLTVGATYRIRHAEYDLNGFHVRDDSQLTMRGVTIWSIPGEGWVVAGKTDNLSLVDCKIAIKPGSGRPISTSSDGFHVDQSCGHIQLIGCDFGYCGDDCVNIHDNFAQGIAVVDSHTIRSAAAGDRWRTPMAAGDAIAFYRGDLAPTGFESKITSITLDAQRATIAFADPLPPSLEPDTILFNTAYRTDHVDIEKCDFHDNRGRGILLSADDAVIADTTIESTSAEAIYVETEAADLWSEGIGTRNLWITRDQFDNVNQGGGDYDGSAIVLEPIVPAGRVARPIYNQVRVTDNVFGRLAGSPLRLRSASDVIFTGNLILTGQSMNPLAGVLTAADVSGLTVAHNHWIAKLPATGGGLRYNPGTVEGVKFSDNITFASQAAYFGDVPPDIGFPYISW